MTEPQPIPPSWRDRLDLLAQPSKATPAQVVAAAVAVVAVAVVAWLLLRQPPGPPPEATLPRAHPASATSTTSAAVVVHAAGAVRTPGLYRMPPGARVDDLLRAAGGAAADADLDRVNLAAPLVDGSRVYVPRVGEAAPPVAAGGGTGDPTADGPLDLNTATAEQLDALPGIGPATAKAIIEARTRRGRFTSVDDLLAVRGIGPAKLDAIRDLVSV